MKITRKQLKRIIKEELLKMSQDYRWGKPRKNIKRRDPRYPSDSERLAESGVFGLWGDSKKAKQLERKKDILMGTLKQVGTIVHQNQTFDIEPDAYNAEDLVAYVAKAELGLLDHEEMGATSEEKEAYAATFGGGQERGLAQSKAQSRRDLAKHARGIEDRLATREALAQAKKDIQDAHRKLTGTAARHARSEATRDPSMGNHYQGMAGKAIKGMEALINSGDSSYTQRDIDKMTKIRNQLRALVQAEESRRAAPEAVDSRYVKEPGEDITYGASGRREKPSSYKRKFSYNEAQLRKLVREELKKMR